MRFDWLAPAQGPVVEGLENNEKIYALEQSEYLPLRTLPAQGGMSFIYRCEITPEQRKMIAEGADRPDRNSPLPGPIGAEPCHAAQPERLSRR